MFLKVDTSATVGELINGLIIQSGNDSAIALAEQIGGSESGFARLMNEAAVKLGKINAHRCDVVNGRRRKKLMLIA